MEISTEVHMAGPAINPQNPRYPTQGSVIGAANPEAPGFFTRSLHAVEDAALGIGQVFSTASGYLLPGDNTPVAGKLASGTFRAAGGLLTAATSGYRIVKTYQKESAEGSENFPETRKEVVVTAGSVTAGLGVGTLAGAATSVAAFVGAPAIVVGGIAAAGVIGAGLAAYTVGGYISDWYDSL